MTVKERIAGMTSEELRKHTQSSLSRLLGVSRQRISQVRALLPVEMRRETPHVSLLNPLLQDPKKMKQLYVERGMTMQEIAKRLEVSLSTVCLWLETHGIPRRRRGPRKETYDG